MKIISLNVLVKKFGVLDNLRLSRRQDGGPATEPATKATKLQKHAHTKQETVYTQIQEQEQSLHTYDQLADKSDITAVISLLFSVVLDSMASPR